MFDSLRADLSRHLGLCHPPLTGTRALRALVESQAVWATVVYRFGRWSNQGAPPPLRPALKAGYMVLFKLTEIVTGICLPAGARIGKGLYIGHFGGIVIHPDAVLGERCSIAHGVTIGVLGGPRTGVPRLGDDVYVGAGAKILGAVTVGDGAVVGANAVVVDDVPPGATAVGVPARIRPRAEPRPSRATSM